MGENLERVIFMDLIGPFRKVRVYGGIQGAEPKYLICGSATSSAICSVFGDGKADLLVTALNLLWEKNNESWNDDRILE